MSGNKSYMQTPRSGRAEDQADSSVTQSRATPPASSGETVTVACKMPNGVVLQLFDMVPYSPGHGFPETTRAMPRPSAKVVLNGNAIDYDKLRRDQGMDRMIIGGYALTPGVPREFWEEWLRVNKDSALVLNKVVFAADSETRARDQAKDQRHIQSGLEPIDTNNPSARMPASRFRVQTATTS